MSPETNLRRWLYLQIAWFHSLQQKVFKNIIQFAKWKNINDIIFQIFTPELLFHVISYVP